MAQIEKVEISIDGEHGREVLRIPAQVVYHVYRPADSLESVTVGGRRLLRFGFTGAFGSLLLDVSSKSVAERINEEPKVSLVNTSLDAFSRCLEAFSSKFPVDEIDDEEEAEERDNKVAREIEKDIRLIDPEAYRENSFWYEIRWSVAIGDFSD